MDARPPTDPRRRIPRTDDVLADPRLVEATRRLGPALVKQAVRDAQQQARDGLVEPDGVADQAVAALPRSASSARPVLNATGVVLHTNLGRAPLSAAAVEAMGAAAGTTDVEYDLATGRRGRRGAAAIAALAAAVPDAQAVHVVGNGAAALALVATALAQGREMLVSRGEMVEIGDGFRLPDLLQSTGAVIREVGTTNRTTLADYAGAITGDTALVLKIHPSNFTVSGFTAGVGVAELAGLGVPVVHDIGSGLLRPDPLLPHEPDAATSLRDGADLVTASGDKLLGGPQAGLLLGREDLVHACRRHPLQRALRVDKTTLAALEATLTGPTTPTWTALRADADGLRARCDRLARALTDAGRPVEVRPSEGRVGGGGAPGVTLPGWAVALAPDLTAPLRLGEPSVVGRVEGDRLLLDLRCVPADRDDDVLCAVLAARPAGGLG